MNDENPYAPPKAPVKDVETAERPQAPRHVETACQLLWASLGLRLLDAIVKASGMASTKNATMIVAVIIGALIGFAIGFALTFWITRKLRTGRNWMRWLVTVYYAATWLLIGLMWDYFKVFLAPAFANPVRAVSLLVQVVIGVIAVVLLHTAQSRRWFAPARD